MRTVRRRVALARTLTAIAWLFAAALPSVAFAQTVAAPRVPPQSSAASSASTGRLGVAVKVSTLGVGFDAAAKLGSKVNLRAGVNLFSYSRDFDDSDNNITYVGKLTLRSVHAYIDLFPFGGGFHISPGLIVHNGNAVSLTASIVPGQRITIDDTDYVSSSANPINVSGNIAFARTRPAVLLGWGNIVPRNRRFSVPFELGVVFQGAPIATLSFTGTACGANGLNCRDMGSDASIQSDMRAEEANLNKEIKVFRFYPVLSIGFALRF